MRYAFTGLKDLNDAIRALSGKVNAQGTTVITGSSATTGSGTPPRAIGNVNDQTGVTAYSVRQTDYGTLVIFDDASPVAVTLANALVSLPFFSVIENLGAGTATLTPSTGTVNTVASVDLPQDQSALIYFDGINWWATTLPVIPQPGNSTPIIDHDSGGPGISLKYAREDHWHPADSGSSGGGSFTAGGDLSGTSTLQTVIGIQNHLIDGGPTDGNLLVYSAASSEWEPTLFSVPPLIQNGLISGGGVAWVGGLNFIVSLAIYVIAGIQYTSPQTNITLAVADPTNPRIDVIAVDDTGSVVVLTGTPASNPQAPSVDPATQLALTFVLVPAGATTPPGASNNLIYDEDTGTPTEWAATSSGAGWNLASTNNPYSGTKDIEATAVAKTSFVNFVPASSVLFSNYQQLVFYIRSKATWNTARSLTITFYFSGVPQGVSITFKSGSYGFNSATLGVYQQIIIPASQFSIPASVDQLRMTVAGSGTSTIGFYLDDIFLQASQIPPPPPAGPNFADNIIPSGTINGVNTSFLLPNAPNPANSLMLNSDGTWIVTGAGFTLSGGVNLSLVAAPAAVLRAWYRF